MPVEQMVRNIVASKGLRQKWIVERMNAVNPSLNMTRNKLSAITRGHRRMTGDEFLAFCQSVEINPDIFLLTDETSNENRPAG